MKVITFLIVGLCTLCAATVVYASMQITRAERDCLEVNIAQESSGEPLAGQLAVANTTLFRSWVNAKLGKRSSNICDVVYAPHQFSWTSGPPRVITRGARETAKIVAQKALEHFDPKEWPVTHFHAKNVHPRWASKFRFVKRIGDHLFYSSPRGLRALGKKVQNHRPKLILASATKKRVVNTIKPAFVKRTPEPLTDRIATAVAEHGIGGLLFTLIEPRG